MMDRKFVEKKEEKRAANKKLNVTIRLEKAKNISFAVVVEKVLFFA